MCPLHGKRDLIEPSVPPNHRFIHVTSYGVDIRSPKSWESMAWRMDKSQAALPEWLWDFILGIRCWHGDPSTQTLTSLR